MTFLKFAWGRIKLFIFWGVAAWVVFISNIIRRQLDISPATGEEQFWAGITVGAIFILLVLENIVTYRKLHK